MALTDNLTAYWKLDESSGNATDSVASLVLTNANITYTTGIINNGAYSNSNTDKFSCADTAAVKLTSDHSISFWINFTSFNVGPSKYANIMAKQNSGVYGYQLIIINNGVGHTADFAYTISKTTNGSEQTYTAYNWSAVAENTWYHVVWTYTASTNVKLYINGSNVLTNTTSIISSIFDNTKDFELLTTSTDAGTRIMDEVGIWSRALTPTEVISLYNGGNGLPYPLSTTSDSSSFFNLF